MKKSLLLFPLSALLITGCSLKETVNSVKTTIDEKVVAPVKEIMEPVNQVLDPVVKPIKDLFEPIKPYLYYLNPFYLINGMPTHGPDPTIKENDVAPYSHEVTADEFEQYFESHMLNNGMTALKEGQTPLVSFTFMDVVEGHENIVDEETMDVRFEQRLAYNADTNRASYFISQKFGEELDISYDLVLTETADTLYAFDISAKKYAEIPTSVFTLKYIVLQFMNSIFSGSTTTLGMLKSVVNQPNSKFYVDGDIGTYTLKQESEGMTGEFFYQTTINEYGLNTTLKVTTAEEETTEDAPYIHGVSLFRFQKEEIIEPNPAEYTHDESYFAQMPSI